MEQKETAYCNNLLNNSPSETLLHTKTSSFDKSHIAKIENCIDQKSDQAALKDELKENSVLLRSLMITSNNQRNKSSDKTPENLIPNFSSKKNNDDTKEQVPLIKHDVIDFCINDTAIK